MKVTIVLTLLILLSYSCETRIGKTSQAEQLVVDSNQTVYKDNYTDRTPYRDSIPPTNINDHQSLSFKFDLDSSGYILKTIHIYSGDTETQKSKHTSRYTPTSFNSLIGTLMVIKTLPHWLAVVLVDAVTGFGIIPQHQVNTTITDNCRSI